MLARIPNIRATPGGEIEKVDTLVKTDIRIQGFTFLDPFRVYVSKHGYYRSGTLQQNYTTNDRQLRSAKLMHVTHHIPKILSGDFLQGMSGGSLEFWLENFVAKENGLDREEVWKNVKKSLGIWMLGARENICTVDDDVLLDEGVTDGISAVAGNGKQEADKEEDTSTARRTSGKSKGNAYITDASACKSHGFHFTADMIVDSNGRAWVMEVHLTLGIKSPGLGDPEAGYDELLTRETRQGVMYQMQKCLDLEQSNLSC